MANYNKVILLGNLTRDPELKYLPSGTAVCEFGIAVNRRWKGQEGEQQESTCFIDCRCYGPRGETINQYMSKGRQILVEGRLDFQQWTAQDGSKRSKHLVIVENFQFMDSRGGAAAEESGGGAPTRAGRVEPAAPGPTYEPEPGTGDSDIPF